MNETKRCLLVQLLLWYTESTYKMKNEKPTGGVYECWKESDKILIKTRFLVVWMLNQQSMYEQFLTAIVSLFIIKQSAGLDTNEAD